MFWWASEWVLPWRSLFLSSYTFLCSLMAIAFNCTSHVVNSFLLCIEESDIDSAKVCHKVEVYPFRKQSHPIIFWWRIADVRIVWWIGRRSVAAWNLRSYGILSTKDSFYAKTINIWIGVLVLVRSCNAECRKIDRWAIAWCSSHFMMWAKVSIAKLHLEQMGDDSRPWQHRDAKVGIHPWISFTVVARQCIFKYLMYWPNAKILTLSNANLLTCYPVHPFYRWKQTINLESCLYSFLFTYN